VVSENQTIKEELTNPGLPGEWPLKLYSVRRKKDPSTKTSISSKRRNIFVRTFQRLLGRKFATAETVFVQCYESLRKWCDFRFSMRYFQMSAPL